MEGSMARIAVQEHTRVAPVTGPLYLLLYPFPVVLFLGALVTDIAYARSEFLLWLHFSEWLIAVGLLLGAVAAVVLLIEFLAAGAIRAAAFGWAHLVLFYAALIVELFNAFVHSIDGWTAVVPTGMILSILGAIVALASVWTLFLVPVAWVVHRRVLR
jgi:uncharacterized membrane protein